MTNPTGPAARPVCPPSVVAAAVLSSLSGFALAAGMWFAAMYHPGRLWPDLSAGHRFDAVLGGSAADLFVFLPLRILHVVVCVVLIGAGLQLVRGGSVRILGTTWVVPLHADGRRSHTDRWVAVAAGIAAVGAIPGAIVTGIPVLAGAALCCACVGVIALLRTSSAHGWFRLVSDPT